MHHPEAIDGEVLQILSRHAGRTAQPEQTLGELFFDGKDSFQKSNAWDSLSRAFEFLNRYCDSYKVSPKHLEFLLGKSVEFCIWAVRRNIEKNLPVVELPRVSSERIESIRRERIATIRSRFRLSPHDMRPQNRPRAERNFVASMIAPDKKEMESDDLPQEEVDRIVRYARGELKGDNAQMFLAHETMANHPSMFMLYEWTRAMMKQSN